METLSVVLEALIVLMLCGLFAFRLRQQTDEARTKSSEGLQQASHASSLETLEVFLPLVAGIDRKLEKLLSKNSPDLPWTELLAKDGDRKQAFNELSKRRQELDLSLTEELEFSSCALIAILGYLLEALPAEGAQTKTRLAG